MSIERTTGTLLGHPLHWQSPNVVPVRPSAVQPVPSAQGPHMDRIAADEADIHALYEIGILQRRAGQNPLSTLVLLSLLQQMQWSQVARDALAQH